MGSKVALATGTAVPGEAMHPLAVAVTTADGMARRRAIAKAITLLESTRSDHRAEADRLLAQLMPHAGRAFRLGLSGTPGVGKSTLIESLGLHLIAQGHSVAVLTIDPSSAVSGGSILGDKTRMEKLSVHDKAFIRPSPSSGNLGGVAEMTREAMLVLEAAGFDVVIVETVGVGQSEVAVAGMTDMYVLMQLPNAGDELQAIKKGVMELADLVLINKADLDPAAASRARAQITSSLRLIGQHGNPQRAGHDPAAWQPQVLQLSALSGQGVDALWLAASEFREKHARSGAWDARRRQQALAWMWERIDAGLRQAFRADASVRARLPGVAAGCCEWQLARVGGRARIAGCISAWCSGLRIDSAGRTTGSGRMISLTSIARIESSTVWRNKRVEIIDLSEGRMLVKGQRPLRGPWAHRIPEPVCLDGRRTLPEGCTGAWWCAFAGDRGPAAARLACRRRVGARDSPCGRRLFRHVLPRLQRPGPCLA